MASNIKITLLFPLHFTFGLAIKPDGFTLAQDLAFTFLLNCPYWLHVSRDNSALGI